jgi:hypothetical protein
MFKKILADVDFAESDDAAVVSVNATAHCNFENFEKEVGLAPEPRHISSATSGEHDMLAASIESFFIFLLIAAGSAVFNWFKNRGENGTDWSETEAPPPGRRPPVFKTPTAPAVPRPTQTTNWEEELRRMLEGTIPTTRTPPPVVIQERKTPPAISRPPAPERVEAPTMSLPKSFEQKFYKAHCNNCDGHIEFPASAMDEVIACPHCRRPTVLRPFEETPVEVLAHQNVMADFKTTEKTYEEASQLSQRVAAHMHEVGYKPVGMTSIESTKKLWKEVAETKALFKNAKTVRQAMIASLIFGEPKAFES